MISEKKPETSWFLVSGMNGKNGAMENSLITLLLLYYLLLHYYWLTTDY